MENPDPVTVDYTQVLHQEHLLKNVLNFLPDDTLDDTLDSLSEVDENFQREVNSERRRRISQKLLTYGAAAVREGHEGDERALTDILGDHPNFKTSKDAMTFVARTFSGAKHDFRGPYTLDNLYPIISHHPSFPNPSNKPAFERVYNWWRSMCYHHKDIAIKTDLLSFFLFAGENWKAKNSIKTDPSWETDELKDSRDVLRVHSLPLNFILQLSASFRHNVRNGQHYVSAVRQISFNGPDNATSMALICGFDRVTLITYVNSQDQERHVIFKGDFLLAEDDPLELRIDMVSTPVWAHACVNKLTATSDIESFSPTYLEPQNLISSHETRASVISRKVDSDVDFERQRIMNPRSVMF